MAHVRDEVTAHALDAPRLRHVSRERDRADHLAVAPERERPQLEHLTRRPVELELALRRDAVERGVQQLVDRVLREHLAVARAVEAARRRVAHDLTTDAVDDDDRVGRLVERGQQPVLHGLGARDAIRRLSIRLGDRIDERDRRRRASSHGAARVAPPTTPPRRQPSRPGRDEAAGSRRDPPAHDDAGVATHPNRPVM